MNSASLSGFEPADRIMNAVKKNPEGLLLLAAGCALLFRTGRSGRGGSSRPGSWPNAYETRGRTSGHETSGRQDRGWDMPEAVSQGAERARQYAADVGDTVSETARSYASAASDYAQQARDYAQQARDTIKDQSGRIAQQTQSTMQNVVRQQPFAVAVAGLAAGAAIATLFPATRMEREALGPAASRLADAAAGAGEKLSEAASAAGDRLMASAKERGVSTEGLKEVAREVAGSFQKSLSGSEQDAGRSSAQTAGTVRSGSPSTAAPAGSAGTAGRTSSPGGSSFGGPSTGR